MVELVGFRGHIPPPPIDIRPTELALETVTNTTPWTFSARRLCPLRGVRKRSDTSLLLCFVVGRCCILSLSFETSFSRVWSSRWVMFVAGVLEILVVNFRALPTACIIHHRSDWGCIWHSQHGQTKPILRNRTNIYNCIVTLKTIHWVLALEHLNTLDTASSTTVISFTQHVGY